MSPRVNLNLNTILETAAGIANRQGIGAVTLSVLAKELNIKPPSLYNHFNGMDGLRLNLAIYGINKLYDLLAESTIGKSGDDAIRELSNAYLSFAREYPGLYNAIILAPDPKNSELQLAGDKIVDLILRVLSAYNLQEEEKLHIVRGLRSTLHGFASLEQNGGFGIPLNPNDSLRIMINILITGINSIKEKM